MSIEDGVAYINRCGPQQTTRITCRAHSHEWIGGGQSTVATNHFLPLTRLAVVNYPVKQGNNKLQSLRGYCDSYGTMADGNINSFASLGFCQRLGATQSVTD